MEPVRYSLSRGWAELGVASISFILFLTASLIVARYISRHGEPERESGCEASQAPSAEVLAEHQAIRTPEPGTATVIAAGDIGLARCRGDELTAQLLAHTDGTILALGDLAYPDGTPHDYETAYAPSWGRFFERTRPVPGNHDYHDPAATGYFGYFGPRAGRAGEGWYSFDLNGWHIVALNSNCDYIGGCQSGSAEERWLSADLAAHPAACTLAYSHHPYFSSGRHGADPALADLWSDLEATNAELVLGGHDHAYERFAPQRADGTLDRAGGIRQFVIGTGGRSLYQSTDTIVNSEFRDNRDFGVLRLSLGRFEYRWEFTDIDGSVIDAGSGRCH